MTPEGNTLYLNSGRGRSDKHDVDIWKFNRIQGKWTHAELMGGPLRSNKHDYDPCISPGGQYFYVTSDRDGGLGDADIWVAERIPKKNHRHAAFLRETLHLDFSHPVFSDVLYRLTNDEMNLSDKLHSFSEKRSF